MEFLYKYVGDPTIYLTMRRQWQCQDLNRPTHNPSPFQKRTLVFACCVQCSLPAREGSRMSNNKAPLPPGGQVISTISN